MENTKYKSLTALPDAQVEIITMKSNGKRKIETKTVTKRHLLTLLNGNSVALTEDQLKSFGILTETVVPEPEPEPDPDPEVDDGGDGEENTGDNVGDENV